MSGDLRQNFFSHKYGFESTRIADTVFMATGLQLLLPVRCDSSTCRLPVSLTTFRHSAASGAPLRSLALVRRPRHLFIRRHGMWLLAPRIGCKVHGQPNARCERELHVQTAATLEIQARHTIARLMEGRLSLKQCIGLDLAEVQNMSSITRSARSLRRGLGKTFTSGCTICVSQAFRMWNVCHKAFRGSTAESECFPTVMLQEDMLSTGACPECSCWSTPSNAF